MILDPGYPPEGITHSAFVWHIRELLAYTGYTLTYTTHDSRHSPEGWPDVVTFRPGDRYQDARLVTIEAKVKTGTTPAQEAWLAALALGVPSEAYLVKPPLTQDLVDILQARRRPE